jgi:hypothetical protein
MHYPVCSSLDMSEYENEAYDRFLRSVTTQVEQLRQIVDSLQSKSKERVWFRNQGTGDLDEAKLIEGVSGESNIYKRRAEEQDPLSGGSRAPKKPGALKKRIRFVFDVSGSMYYFNRADQRLQRLLETAVLVMESFHGFEDKFEYAIVGHSGDSPAIDFVDYGQPPQNRKERLQILQQMVRCVCFCVSCVCVYVCVCVFVCSQCVCVSHVFCCVCVCVCVCVVYLSRSQCVVHARLCVVVFFFFFFFFGRWHTVNTAGVEITRLRPQSRQ